MDYVIMTDSSADLPWGYMEEHDIHCLEMTVAMGDETFSDDKSIDIPRFYHRLRAGEVATTSQISSAFYIKAFEEVLRQGKNIILLGLSLALSESYSNACVARDEVKQHYPEREVYVCESTCVTMGLGLLVHELRKRRDDGADFKTLCRWAEDNKSRVHHRFIVDDLMFLHRGGRVSRSAAVVGSLIGIKPLLHVAKSGKLINHGKTRGRKQSLQRLVEDYSRLYDSYARSDVFITHGDCEEEARFVMDEIKKNHRVQHDIVCQLGPVVGAHSGPGTIALFFMGAAEREDD